MRPPRLPFARELGAPVGGSRVRRVVLPIGPSTVAGEHVVGGHLDEFRSGTIAGGGEDPHGGGVHLAGRLLVLLGAVNRRVGRAVDHRFRTPGAHQLIDGVGIADVESVDVVTRDLQTAFHRGGEQRASELSFGAGDEQSTHVGPRW